MPEQPPVSSESVRRRFSRQKRADTRPEMELRRELHRRGLRYRVGYPVPGLPRRSIDIAFPSAKLAVLVDGCFWHACPDHYVPPSSNAAWWDDKIKRNVARDRETDAQLDDQGWEVLRCWEHESATDAADRVMEVVAGRRAGPKVLPTQSDS